MTLLRCGSTTHGFDVDQRYLELAVSSRSTSVMAVLTPPNSRIAPPGSYFLFVINGKGMPSMAKPSVAQQLVVPLPILFLWYSTAVA